MHILKNYRKSVSFLLAYWNLDNFKKNITKRVKCDAHGLSVGFTLLVCDVR